MSTREKSTSNHLIRKHDCAKLEARESLSVTDDIEKAVVELWTCLCNCKTGREMINVSGRDAEETLLMSTIESPDKFKTR